MQLLRYIPAFVRLISHMRVACELDVFAHAGTLVAALFVFCCPQLQLNLCVRTRHSASVMSEGGRGRQHRCNTLCMSGVQKLSEKVAELQPEGVTAALSGLAPLQQLHPPSLLSDLEAVAAAQVQHKEPIVHLTLQLSAFARLEYSPSVLLDAVSVHERALCEHKQHLQHAILLLWALLKLEGGMDRRGRLIEMQRRVLFRAKPTHELSDRSLLCVYDVRSQPHVLEAGVERCRVCKA